jgi:hypothetical protein
VLRIRIGFNTDPDTDPDPAFFVIADPDTDPNSDQDLDPALGAFDDQRFENIYLPVQLKIIYISLI